MKPADLFLVALLLGAPAIAIAQSPSQRNPDVSNKALITKSTPSINADTFKNQSVNAATIVLHKLADGQLQPCLEKLAQSDLPNLWKPRPDQFFHLDALPYLGTGKLDLRKVREIAVERSGRGE